MTDIETAKNLLERKTCDNCVNSRDETSCVIWMAGSAEIYSKRQENTCWYWKGRGR